MDTSADCLDNEVIASLAAGESMARGALAHLDECHACRELVSVVCARRTDASPPRRKRLARGTMIGNHCIERPLGAGGMGVVYLARDLDLERDVAVKLLRGDAHDRLVLESQALARLNHPNVVTAYEVGRHEQEAFLVMEYVDGGTVRDWLAREPRSIAGTVEVYAQAARGLAAAHAADLIHRDVKPDNVLVGIDGRARVSDFGLAAGDHDAAGTPAFMAPEVLAGGAADARSDQWSLCASLWDSLFAAPPLVGTSVEDLLAAARAGMPRPPNRVPAWLRRVLARGLNSDPDQRFVSVDALADALSPRPRAARRVAIVMAVVAVAAVGIGVTAVAREASESCSSEIGGAWDANRRAAVLAKLQSSRAVGVLDDYAQRWSEQRVDVCRMQREDRVGRAPALRAACLDRRRQALDVLTHALVQLEQVDREQVQRAMTELPALDDCSSERIADRQPRPRDSIVNAKLVSLERRHDVARVASFLGPAESSVAELVKIVSEARALGFHPLVAEALTSVGRTQQLTLDQRAIETYTAAMLASQAGGDDTHAAHSAVLLIESATRFDRPVAERDAYRAQAHALVSRLAWREHRVGDRLASALAAAEGVDEMHRGHLAAAEVHITRGVRLSAAAYGERDGRVAAMRVTLGEILMRLDRPEAAAAAWAQSLDVNPSMWAELGGIVTAPGEGGVPQAMVDAAWRLHDMGRDDEALTFVLHLRGALDGRHISPMLSLALDDLESEVELARGNLVRARELNVRAFTALGPSPPPAHAAGLFLARGAIAAAEGNCTLAEVDFTKAAASTSDATTVQLANLGIARCLAKAGDLAEARLRIERELGAGIIVHRTKPTTQLLLAELLWKQGITDLARDHAQVADRECAKLPVLVQDCAAVDAWLAAH